jgi:L-2-hydroxyglutarate oxidase
MSDSIHDVAVIGGGIVGLALAWTLSRDSPASVLLLEAEPRLASHQTGHNSGVIHSGLYYRPGSLKARNCAAGRDAIYRFCADRGIAHERCGKLVVAVDPSELPALDELERRGRQNGLTGLRRLGGEELKEHEPHAAGVAALLVPETGIVDYGRVAAALAAEAAEAGAEIVTGARVRGVRRDGGSFRLLSTRGERRARHLVNCGGLQSDRVARSCGVRPDLRIIPFRGEYYKLAPSSEHLVRNLIYPVPDSRFPFLGVHFTRMIGGGVEAGPNAVLALRREGYGRLSFSPRDAWGIVSYGGFWRMASRYWRTGVGEVRRSWSTAAFVASLRRLLPPLTDGDVHRHGAGVRAQAVAPDGRLVDDFHILEAPQMLHVLNAPSPAATASLSIGHALAERARRAFDLPD